MFVFQEMFPLRARGLRGVGREVKGGEKRKETLLLPFPTSIQSSQPTGKRKPLESWVVNVMFILKSGLNEIESLYLSLIFACQNLN